MTKKIELLLEKYFEGETSLQEEKELQEYFNSENVDASLEKYRPMFSYFQKAGLEEFKQKESPVKVSKKRKLFWKIGIAATFLSIFFGVSYYLKQQQEAEVAFEQVKEALQMISFNYNKGTKKIEYLKDFETTTNKIINLNEF
ncbi:hypothetical protein ACI76O_03895 [Capnocytophaga cynodegmi]|uniref:hypothetical protein n=1 Tax=Capnocytophaga cynodegmi TaxID=28189 RepID=UPI001BB44785|nr:hypothetical protein [Capnocytophaga cynodegmi]